MKTQDNVAEEGLAVLIIGGSGTGKSTTALRFPRPGVILAGDNLRNAMKLNPGVTFKYDIIDTDKEGKELPMDRRWERVIELTNEMVKDPDVETVVYDNGTRLGEVLALHLGRKALTEYEQFGQWRLPKKTGWTPLSMEMGQLLMSVRAAGKHLVMTVHDRLKEDELDKVLDIRPFIPGALGRNLPSFFNEYWQTVLEHTGGTTLYKLTAKPNSRIELKTSLPLPATFELKNWATFEANYLRPKAQAAVNNNK